MIILYWLRPDRFRELCLKKHFTQTEATLARVLCAVAFLLRFSASRIWLIFFPPRPPPHNVDSVHPQMFYYYFWNSTVGPKNVWRSALSWTHNCEKFCFVNAEIFWKVMSKLTLSLWPCMHRCLPQLESSSWAIVVIEESAYLDLDPLAPSVCSWQTVHVVSVTFPQLTSNYAIFRSVRLLW